MKRSYSVHGVRLEVSYGDSVYEDALDHLLWNFAAEASDEPDARIRLESLESAPDIFDWIGPSSPVLYSSRPSSAEGPAQPGLEFDVYDLGDSLLVDFGTFGVLKVDGAGGDAEALLAHPGSIHSDILGSLLLFALSELLRPHGLHLIHAAAVDLDGRGVLIPGTRGSGKTTSCLSLVDAGFGFLSDDVVFVRSDGDAVELLGMPERLSVSDQTIAMFPKLSEDPDAMHNGMLKRHFVIDRFFEGVRVESTRPLVLLFPQITHQGETMVESLKPSVALELLLPHAVSVLNRKTARETFSLLTRLVQQTGSYRLHFGTDLEQAAKTIRKTLHEQPCASE